MAENIEIKNLCYVCAGKLPKHWGKMQTLSSPFKCEKCGRVSKHGGTYRYYPHDSVDEEETIEE